MAIQGAPWGRLVEVKDVVPHCGGGEPPDESVGTDSSLAFCGRGRGKLRQRWSSMELVLWRVQGSRCLEGSH